MDAGVGEAAAVESAKGAGEAEAAKGAGEAAAAAGAGETAAAGAGAAEGLTSAETAALFGEAGYGAGMTGAETAAFDAALPSTVAAGGSALDLSSAAAGGAGAVAPNLSATNPALIESALGTGGYGASSATPAALAPGGGSLSFGAGGGSPADWALPSEEAAAQQTGMATGAAPASAPSSSDLAAQYGAGTPGYGDGLSTWDKALKALGATGDAAVKYGPLGMSALSYARQSQVPGAQKQYAGLAKPLTDVQNQLLQQFKTGQISGADAFAIADWAQKQKMAVDSYYSKAGLSNSSMHTEALSHIDQQAEAMRQQAVDNLLKQGLAAAGMANPLLTAGITAGIKQDEDSQKAMADFIAQLARMNSGAGQQQTGTPGG